MKRIVFVDDEQDLLDGLRARLYKHRHDWDMHFFVRGEDALADFSRQPIDLIVSDVRMPGIDGGQLLALIKERWPSTIRIIVSGYSDPVQAVRLTSLAHQYVAKPCDGVHLENIIERCFHLQALLGQEGLRTLVGRIGRLPAMPSTYGKLQTALASPAVTAAQIGEIVHSDAAIASKVLQITNSAFFRLRKPMVRIKDAVTYLGFATIRNLVLSAEIFARWNTPSRVLPDPEQLQQHAQNMAAACRSLSTSKAAADDAWLAGLLHDIGYWVLAQECPRELALAIEQSRAEKRPLFECERDVIGATHAEIGAYLLGLWGLPYPIVEAVALHHAPHLVESHQYDLLATVALSHAILEGVGMGGVDAQPQRDPRVLSYLEHLTPPFGRDEAERRVCGMFAAEENPHVHT